MINLIHPRQKYYIYGLCLSSLYIQLCLQHNVQAKTATRSGILATATQMGGSGSSPQDSTINYEAQRLENFYANPHRNLTTLEKLKRDIFRGYDKNIRPVLDYRDNVNIEIDLTYRQILDLDEKNQILKCLIWYRQYWNDVHLKWQPAEYDGMEKISIPTRSVWKPDLVLYEGVGASANGYLPFVQLTYTGQITLTEPRILETSCSVDTAFFPFDTQKCSFTFVSWTHSVKHVDLTSQRTSEALEDESLQFFINTGEWVLKKFGVTKQIASYYTEEPGSLEFAEQDKVYIEIPANQRTTETNIGRKITDKLYAEVMFSLIIRRNSSLYMQSMLFPSILLSSVALLGFFLPPESGERVGLQITILLTFMVFLLTVGEMFPASTGPLIGVYFAISMAQLGINIAMTITVLYLHFKPCIRDKSTWTIDQPRWYTIRGVQYEGDSMIPVRTRRLLQFFEKYFDIAEEGAVWMRPIDFQQNTEGTYVNERYKTMSPEESDENKATDISTVGKLHRHPTGHVINSNNDDSENMLSEEKSVLNVSKSEDKKGQLSTETDASSNERDTKESNKISEMCKIMHGLQLNIKDLAQNIKQNKGTNNDDKFEESMEKEQEEWQSVARAVDNLFFRIYLFLMVTSYIALIAVAINANLNLEYQI